MNVMKRTTLALALGLLALGAAQNAGAAGTAAGTDISNSASVSYDVGGNPQPPKPSNTVTFKVDRKINLTVARTDVALLSVSPGQTKAVLTFTVTNNGNATQDFSLQAIAKATGTADPFGGATNDSFNDAGGTAYVETAGGAGYQEASDTATSIDDLAADGVKTVYVVFDVPAGQADASVAVYALQATAKETDGSAITETAGADTPGAVDTVFADAAGTEEGAREANHSARSACKVVSANLGVTKAAAIISDPVNGAITPKAIPGAIIEYTITVSNSAGAGLPATNIVITDNLDTEITASRLSFKTDGYAADKGIEVTSPNLYSGSATALTNVADTDEGSFSAGNVVTVSGISLNAGQTATVKFRVTVL